MTVDTLICVHSQDEAHDRLLIQAMGSVLTGSVLPNKLVVVFDACWDKTQKTIDDVFDSYALNGVEYVPVAKSMKQGLAIAKNFGLKFCTSEYVTYCDADDMWLNSKLELQSKYCENSNIDFCFTQSWDVIGPKDILVPNCFPVGHATTHEAILARIGGENILCHGSAMIRRSALEALGGYNTDRRLLGREDWDLWIRGFQAGFRFYNIPERLYCYRLGTSVAR